MNNINSKDFKKKGGTTREHLKFVRNKLIRERKRERWIGLWTPKN
jgi:hypothetical protein